MFWEQGYCYTAAFISSSRCVILEIELITKVPYRASREGSQCKTKRHRERDSILLARSAWMFIVCSFWTSTVKLSRLRLDSYELCPCSFKIVEWT